MSDFLQDLRLGARMLRKQGGTSIIAVVALALGIGLTTMMFSITYGALYRGLPLEDADRIMHLERTNVAEGINSMEVTIHDFRDWRAQQTTFDDIAAFYQGTVNVSGSEGRPERFNGAFMSANSFEVLRQRPLLGRTFLEGEDSPDAPPVAIIGYDMWETRYEADPAIVGRMIRVNGEPAEIVGVMPQGFYFPLSEAIWVPLTLDPARLERGQGQTLEVFGRLAPGVTVDRAGAEFATITGRLAMEYPETNEGVGAVMKPYTKEYIGDEPARLLWTMLGAVFFVLLIACANVANLLLSRAAVRSREVAVRSALGANRWRVVRQMLAETLAMAIVGGAIGLGLAWVGVQAFWASVIDTDPPYWIDVKIDPIVMIFVLSLVLVTTLFAGLLPALRASGQNLHETLKDEARGSSSMRLGKLTRALVVVEVALSCGLLVAAGLTIKSVTKLRTLDYGFDAERIFTARLGLFEGTYPDSLARQQFFNELPTRLVALPGVESATLSPSLPAIGGWGAAFGIEGAEYQEDRDYPIARYSLVTPGFFETFNMKPIQGRVFGGQDDGNNLPVAVANESFVARFFPNEDPIGKRIRLGRSDSQGPWRTVVGVVPDTWMRRVDSDDPFQGGFYIPLSQADAQFLSIAVKTRGDAAGMAPTVRGAVEAIDPDLPLYWMQTLKEGVTANTWFYRVFGSLFMVFGFAALFLASVGLYGVLAFSVSRRTQEIGIRMAMGAHAKDVLRMVLRQGMTQIGVGLVLGLALAAWLSRLLQIILYDVNPRDPMIFLGIVAVLLATGILASVVPARRATQVDPLVALRYE
jgi:predicted permease